MCKEMFFDVKWQPQKTQQFKDFVELRVSSLVKCDFFFILFGQRDGGVCKVLES